MAKMSAVIYLLLEYYSIYNLLQTISFIEVNFLEETDLHNFIKFWKPTTGTSDTTLSVSDRSESLNIDLNSLWIDLVSG